MWICNKQHILKKKKKKDFLLICSSPFCLNYLIHSPDCAALSVALLKRNARDGNKKKEPLTLAEIIPKRVCGSEAGGRCPLSTHPPTPLQGKVIGESFFIEGNWVKNSRTIEGGVWALPKPHISCSGDLPNHTCTEQFPCRPKGEQCQGMLYPDVFAVGSILAKRCVRTHGRNLRYIKCRLWTRQIKMTGQMKPRRNTV